MSVVSYSGPVAQDDGRGTSGDGQPHRSVSQLSNRDPYSSSVQLLPYEGDGESQSKRGTGTGTGGSGEASVFLGSSVNLTNSQPAGHSKSSSHTRNTRSRTSNVTNIQPQQSTVSTHPTTQQSSTSFRQTHQQSNISSHPQTTHTSINPSHSHSNASSHPRQHSNSMNASHHSNVSAQQPSQSVQYHQSGSVHHSHPQLSRVSQPVTQQTSIRQSSTGVTQQPVTESNLMLSQPVSQPPSMMSQTIQSMPSHALYNTRSSMPVEVQQSVPLQPTQDGSQIPILQPHYNSRSSIQQEVQSVVQGSQQFVSQDGLVPLQSVQGIPSQVSQSQSNQLSQPPPSQQLVYQSGSGQIINSSNGSRQVHIIPHSSVQVSGGGGYGTQMVNQGDDLSTMQFSSSAGDVCKSTFGNVALRSDGSVVARQPTPSLVPTTQVMTQGESQPQQYVVLTQSHSGGNPTVLVPVQSPQGSGGNMWSQPMQLVPVMAPAGENSKAASQSNIASNKDTSNLPQLVGGENSSVPSSVESIQLVPRHGQTWDMIDVESEPGSVPSESSDSVDLGEGSVAYQGLKEIFTRIDKQNKGVLTRAALIKALRTDNVVRRLMHLPSKIGQGSTSQKNFERIFQTMDADDDREVTWEEFRNAYFGCQLSMFKPRKKPSRIPESPRKSRSGDGFKAPPAPPPTAGQFSQMSNSMEGKTYSQPPAYNRPVSPTFAAATEQQLSYSDLNLPSNGAQHQLLPPFHSSTSPPRGELSSPRKSQHNVSFASTASRNTATVPITAVTYPAHPVGVPVGQQEVIQRARTKVVSPIPVITGMAGEDESELLRELSLSKDLGDTAESDLKYGDAMSFKGMEADALLAYQNSFKLLLQALDVHTKLRSHATLKNNRRINNRSLIEMTRLLGLSNTAKEKIQIAMSRLSQKQDVADAEVVLSQREGLPFSPEPPDTTKDFHIPLGDDKKLSPTRPAESPLPKNPFGKRLSPKRNRLEDDVLVLPPVPTGSTPAYSKAKPTPPSQPQVVLDPRRVVRNQSSGDVVSVSPRPGHFQVVQTPQMVPQPDPVVAPPPQVSSHPPCPRCNGAVTEFANFCQVCGAALFRRS